MSLELSVAECEFAAELKQMLIAVFQMDERFQAENVSTFKRIADFFLSRESRL